MARRTKSAEPVPAPPLFATLGDGEPRMDVLKQLETKLRALVDQRNQLRDELTRLQEARASEDQESAGLRQRLEDLAGERDALLAEREGLRKDVEKILKLLEGVG